LRDLSYVFVIIFFHIQFVLVILLVVYLTWLVDFANDVRLNFSIPYVLWSQKRSYDLCII